jgi:two-component system, NtrC family, nitrogen regulation sensor histidine kinase NtrY
MRKRLFYWFATVLLAICVVAVVWEGSVRFRSTNPTQTFIFWAMSILTFIVMVTLGWVVFRTGVKLYMERQANREGSRIGIKLVLGALILVSAPVVCLVLGSYFVLSANMNRWFTDPMQNQLDTFTEMASMFQQEMQDETTAQAGLLAAQPETFRLVRDGVKTPGVLEEFGRLRESKSVAIYGRDVGAPLDSWVSPGARPDPANEVAADYAIRDGDKLLGTVVLTATIPLNLQQKRAEIRKAVNQWNELASRRKETRVYYIMLESLITLFVLFVATWIALFVARQISVPIAAILDGASQVRKGNLKYRVQVKAVDELGFLVRGFNQMTEELESSASELDRRRRFTEAILESIPTGVLSIGADGSIQLVNQALLKIFPPGQVVRATRLEDLFSRDDTAEIKYLMKRARRTGMAARQMDLSIENRTLNLSVTVAAIEEKLTSGFVIVLEDTSELLRAQKSAAWHEVARRVAHEIKNPLTPIALCADRIQHQLDRLDLPHPAARIIRECADTISKSVDSVKMLVDEFSQFARFPAAQPVRSDLNDVVRDALAVFKDRLEGIAIQTSFAFGLPAVNVDREQFQRVVVNLVDNAAEAMQESLVKTLFVATQPGAAESVELVIADSGPGVSPEDKEKLFLPYFSTKNRGTGLGLAIVSHIVAEHGGQIRVEDNKPAGARFTVEIPALPEPENTPAEPARPAVART